MRCDVLNSRSLVVMIFCLLLISTVSCSSQTQEENVSGDVQTKPDYGKGIDFGNKGDWDAAISSYSKAIRMNPNNADAYIRRGLAYQERGMHNKAIEDFSEVIRLNPNYGEAYHSRGLAYEKTGMQEEASEDFKEAESLGFMR